MQFYKYSSLQCDHGKEMSISGLFVHTESEYYLRLE
jgi:hypothetical protein